MVVARVRRTIEARGLIAPRSRVLCACSGGPDSAALLYCLSVLRRELDFDLVAASVDHGLRPDAHLDLALAAEQSSRVGVEFHALKVSVAAGGSVQAQARSARYQALSELAVRLGCERVAVGHTQDDQAETVLARMLRGAGLVGLAAIQPSRKDGVVRPLLDCRRESVHRLAMEKFPAVASDRSNLDPRFERVRIRSHVLPALLAEDAEVVRHLAQLADDARDCGSVLDGLVDNLLPQVASDGRTLIGPALRVQPRAVRVAVMRRFVQEATGRAPGRAELEQLDATLCSDRGEVWLAAGYCLRASRDGHLRLVARDRPTGQNG